MALSPKENFDPPRSGITPNVSYADAVVNKKFLSTTKRSLLIEQQPTSASGTSTMADLLVSIRPKLLRKRTIFIINSCLKNSWHQF